MTGLDVRVASGLGPLQGQFLLECFQTKIVLWLAASRKLDAKTFEFLLHANALGAGRVLEGIVHRSSLRGYSASRVHRCWPDRTAIDWSICKGHRYRGPWVWWYGVVSTVNSGGNTWRTMGKNIVKSTIVRPHRSHEKGEPAPCVA